VADMLGSVGGDLVWPLLLKVAAGDGPGALAEADRIAERGLSCDQALQDIASILHRVALAQNGAELASDDPDKARIEALAGQLEASCVQVMYQIAVLGRRDLSLAPDELAGFGMAVMRMLSFAGAVRGSAKTTGTGRTASAPAAAIGKSGIAAPQIVAEAPAYVASPTSQPALPPEVPIGGNWVEFVERQNFSGMAGLLARYGEMISFESNHLQLALPESQRMYAEKAYQEKLRAELATQFGAGFRLSVKVGQTTGSSVAAIRGSESQKRLDVAAAALERDPFVRDLVDGMGAQVIGSSIRPAGEAESEKTGNRRADP
jgi:DNA polymerase III subunit gamma/tau